MLRTVFIVDLKTLLLVVTATSIWYETLAPFTTFSNEGGKSPVRLPGFSIPDKYTGEFGGQVQQSGESGIYIAYQRCSELQPEQSWTYSQLEVETVIAKIQLYRFLLLRSERIM